MNILQVGLKPIFSESIPSTCKYNYQIQYLILISEIIKGLDPPPAPYVADVIVERKSTGIEKSLKAVS